MKIESVYRILTFLLLPIAGIFAMVDLMAILSALAQPAMLLSVFIIGCMVIYVFVSYKFLITGIERAKPCKNSLKDWIKVNAYVCIFFIAMSFIQTFMILSQPIQIQKMMTELISQQQGNFPTGTTADLLVKMMKGILYFLAAYAAILLAHVILTFKLLKKYNHVFDGPED